MPETGEHQKQQTPPGGRVSMIMLCIEVTLITLPNCVVLQSVAGDGYDQRHLLTHLCAVRSPNPC